MPRTTAPQFHKSLIALAASTALTPYGAWAVDLVQSPPLPTSKSAFVAPNVIISVDDSGSMNFCSNYENSSGCPTNINNNSRTQTTTYSCQSGYSKDDSSNPPDCYKRDNTKRTQYYTCQTGYTLSGSNCKKNGTNTIDNEKRITNYSCSSGYTLNSNNDCIIIDNSKRITTITYSCGSGQYKNTLTNDCYDTGNATNETTPPWKGTTKRINVLKYSLNNVFKDVDIVPDGKIRLAWQSLNGTGTTAIKASDVNSPSIQKTNTMRPLKGAADVAGTHRNNFIKFINGLSPSGSTPSHEMFSQADAYLRAATHKNGPWSTDPGGTGNKSTEYLGCRRNYHIMMTDGRWNGTPIDVPDLNKRDNATNLAIGRGKNIPTYTGNDSTLYRDESTGTTLADWAFYSWAVPLQESGSLEQEDKLRPSTLYTEAPDTEIFGAGNDQVTLKKFWNPKYNPATWPHLVTYTIGFGEAAYTWNYSSIIPSTQMTPFGYDGSFPALAKGSITWPDLTKSTESRNALDLWHAALNGRGRFYAIQQGDELEQAFREIIGKINEESAQLPEKILSGGGTTGYSVTQNNAGLFSTVYEAKKGWKGYVTATSAREPEEYACPTPEDPEKKCIKFESSVSGWTEGGEAKTTADRLDALSSTDIEKRLILTWSDKDAKGATFIWDNLSTTQKSYLGKESTDTTAAVKEKGENILKFIRGDMSLQGTTEEKPFRERESRQGDIVNSEIWYTGAPISSYGLSGYSDFSKTWKNRLPMLYVGGNDGMLHGFSAKNGEEKISYVPRGVIPELKNLADKDYEHQYYVDGSPMAGDVYDGTSWKTLLVGTLGAGGRGYFVLDVTNPEGFTSATPANLVVMDRTERKRKISDPKPDCTASSLSTNEKLACIESLDIGHITTHPTRNPSNLQEAMQITRMNNGRWAVVMGNGYNSPNQRAVLLIQYLDGNKELLRIQTSNASTGSGNANDNGLTSPSLVDLNGDNKVDVAYAGDNLGNLWKFDLTSNLDSDWAVQFGKDTPLFTARGPATLGGSRSKVQPITAPPIVRPNDRMMTIGSGTSAKDVAIGGMMVAFGTGRNLTNEDRRTDITQNVQTLYSVLDNTRYRKRTGPNTDGLLEVHPGAGDCNSAPQKCVPVPAVVGTISSSGAPLAKQEIVTVEGDFGTVNATNELTKTSWKDYKGWYLDLPGKGERLLKPMQFYDGSNILAFYSESPSGTKSSSSDNINESCVDVKVDTSAGSQWRTLVNIMDGKRPSVQLVDINGDEIFNSDDKNVSRLVVNTGTSTLITSGNKILDYTGVGAGEKPIVGARMPEQATRPSWRQLN